MIGSSLRRLVVLAFAVQMLSGCGQGNRPPVAVLDGPNAVLSGQATAFDCTQSFDPDGDPIVCQFDFGDGSATVSGVRRAVHAYTAPGTYVTTLTVTDDRGGNATFALQVAVGQGVPPIVAFTAPGGAIVSEDVVIDAQASSDPDGRIVSMMFDFGDGVSQTGDGLQSVSHAYGSAGTYTIEVVARDDQGLVGRASRTIVIESGTRFNTPPTACFTAPTAAFSNAAISADAGCSVGPGAQLGYTFDFGDGQPARSGRVVTHSYAQPGTYTIRLVLTATYTDGSTATAVMTSDIAIVDHTVLASTVSPSSGGVAGGELITVKGSGFTSATDTTVTLGGQNVLDLTVVDANTLTFRLPPGIAGGQDLRIENSNGVTVLATAFTYLGGSNRASLAYCPRRGSATDAGFVAWDDDAVRAVTMPFDFPFFDRTIAAGAPVYISSNGALSFSDAIAPFANATIPSANNPDQLVAPFFDDLNIGAGTVETLLSGLAPNRVFTVRWKNVVDNATQRELLDFEASLYESSGDIKFQYANPTINGASSSGQSATIGLQDDASVGVQASANSVVQGLAPGGVVYRFAYEAAVYTVDESRTLTVSASNPVSDGTVASTGNIVLTTSRPVNARTVAANGTVKVWNLTDAAAFTAFSAAVIGDKTQIQVSPTSAYRFGHRYLLTVTSGVADVNGSPLSQDPAQVTCGTVGTPVSFGLTFTATASLVGTSNGLPGGGGPTGVALFTNNGKTYVIDVKDSGRIQTFLASDLNNNLDDQGFGGGSYFDVVVHPSMLTAYVSDDGNGELYMIDLSDPENLGQVGGSPYALSGNQTPARMALSSDGTRLWIADDGDEVHVFDTVNLQELDTDGNGGNGITPISVSGGCRPYDVALASGKAYVACRGSRRIEVIDQTTFAVSSINLPNGGARSRGVVANPSGTRVYVANRNDSTVEVIDTASDTVIDTITIQDGGGSPQDITMTHDGRFVLVLEDGNDTLTIIDASDGSIVQVVTGFNGAFSVATAPSDYLTIVTNNNNDTLAKVQ